MSPPELNRSQWITDWSKVDDGVIYLAVCLNLTVDGKTSLGKAELYRGWQVRQSLHQDCYLLLELPPTPEGLP